MENTLQVSIKMHQASDYAGTIEALKARKLEFARSGPASYAQAWLVTGGKVEPIVVEMDSNGLTGYHSVIAVKANSPYQSLDDLKDKSLAYADPNSTSGHVAPAYFLHEAGIEPETFFGCTGFSGGHENSILALLNGTYDAAAMWWTNEELSNVTRMEGKKMIPQGQVRYIWKSPKMPTGPWTVHTDLPAALKADVRATLVALTMTKPEVWKDITDGKSKGVQEIVHADYEPIIRMIKANMGTLLGATSAWVRGFPATRNLAPNLWVYSLCRRCLEIARTVPELVYALMFVYAFGLGPLPGVLAIAVHSLGSLGKLFSEVTENIDGGPIEGVRAAGATWWQIVRYAVVPQVLPNFASYTLLRFEINVRASSVVGFVGAGGIGQELYTVIRQFIYVDISAIVLLLIVTVALLDITCEQLRHRLIGAQVLP
jgi:phosphonate ABC transporter permease subunit PhnE